MTRNRHVNSSQQHISQQRVLLAETAARLIAVDGITDYALAKRKAARQLGADETRNLPTNAEVDEALRAYRWIYQRDSHPGILAALRAAAVRLMRWLQDFEPYLTGSVLSGTAGAQSDINLLVLSDDPKQIEFFLLNSDILYRHIDCAITDGVSMAWDSEGIAVVLTVVPERRARLKAGQNHGQPERARLEQVELLLRAPADAA